MLYMILLIVFMLKGLIDAVKVITSQEGAGVADRILTGIGLVLSLLVAAPWIGMFYATSGPVPLQELTSLSVGSQWAGLAAAVMLTVVQVVLARRAKKKFFATGAAFAAALLAFIYADSLYFVSDKTTGVVSTFVLDDGGSNDVQCERDQLLVHYNQQKKTEWRCPTSVMFYADSGRPFVPWPGYHTGSSEYLTKAISAMLNSAEKH